MARPEKCRHICSSPQKRNFICTDNKETADEEIIRLNVEELEVIRLMDLLNMTQEECAHQLGVSRTTVQRIYIGARNKVADFLVNGRSLHIEGGSFEECQYSNECCKRVICPKHNCRCDELDSHCFMKCRNVD